MTRRSLFWCVLLVLSGGSAGAQELSVPGGTRAFKCATELPAGIPPERVLIELARRDVRLGDDAPARRYARWLAELVHRMRPNGSDHTIAFRSGDRNSQRAVENVVEWLGYAANVRNGRLEIREKQDDQSVLRARYAACLEIRLPGLADAVAKAPIRIVPEHDSVPALLAPATWLTLPGLASDSNARDPFTAITRDNRALLLYYGLSRVDATTRAWLEGQPALLRWLHENAAPRFAAFSHGLRWRDGKLEMPGGPATAAVWQRAVDRPVGEPTAFVRALLGRDDGRIAHLWSTLFGVPDATVKELTAPRNLERLTDIFKSSASQWKVDDQPFGRPISDPAFALLMLTAHGASLSDGPAWQRVWEAGFAELDLSTKQANLARDITRGDRVDLLWLLSAVTTDGTDTTGRLQLARYARRVFRTLAPADAGYAGVVLGAFGRLQGLLLELEHLGVQEPRSLAHIVETAFALSRPDPKDAAVPLVAWQATLAFVSAGARGGAIPQADAVRLIEELSVMRPGRDGRWGDALLRFLWDKVLPATEAAEERAIDDGALSFLTGGGGAASPEFEWEGLRYRASLSQARFARARAIARAQSRATLDDVLRIAGVVDSLNAAKTVAQIKTATSVLIDVQGRLPKELPPLYLTDGKPLELQAAVGRIVRDLQRITRDRDATRARRQVASVTWLHEELYADSLPAVIYAARLAIGLPRPESVADLWRRHEYGFRLTGDMRDPFLGWRMPTISAETEGGLHVRGALIGMETALGELWMRRLAGGPPPRPSRLADAQVRAIGRSLALLLTRPASPSPTGADQSGGWGFAALDGSCYCLEPTPFSGPSELLTGRPTTGSLLALLPELNVRVLAFARSIQAPEHLVPLALAAVYQDVLDGADMAHPDDWESIAAFVRDLSRERLEEYLFALIGTRELTAVARRP